MCICEHQVSKEQTLRYIEIKVVRHQRQSINHAEEVCSRSLLTLFVMCLQIDHIANNLSHLLQSESKCKAFHMKISFSIYQTSEYVCFFARSDWLLKLGISCSIYCFAKHNGRAREVTFPAEFRRDKKIFFFNLLMAIHLFGIY